LTGPAVRESMVSTSDECVRLLLWSGLTQCDPESRLTSDEWEKLLSWLTNREKVVIVLQVVFKWTDADIADWLDVRSRNCGGGICPRSSEREPMNESLRRLFAKILWGHADAVDDLVTVLMNGGPPSPGQFEVLWIADGGSTYEVVIRNYGTRFKVESKVVGRFLHVEGPTVEMGGCPGEWDTADGVAFAGLLRAAFLDLASKFEGAKA